MRQVLGAGEGEGWVGETPIGAFDLAGDQALTAQGTDQQVFGFVEGRPDLCH
jgi:hypothetical protein